MRKLTFCTVFVLLLLSHSVNAQTQRTDYKKVDYIAVDEDQLQQFITIAEDEAKSIYQEMVDSGKIKSWELYIVNYPGGERSNYNLVSVVTASDIRVLEDSFSKGNPAFFLPASEETNGAEKLASLSTLIASEIWNVAIKMSQDSVRKSPSRFMTMDYMNVGEGDGPGYLTLEDEVAKPLHEARAEQGRMAGWEVYSLVVPGGTEYGYNYATGNYFNHIGDVEFGFTRELIKQTITGTNTKELLNTIYNTRDLVKSELWELVTYAN